MFPFYCELMLAAIQKSNYTRTNLQAEIPPGEARTRWKPWLITLCCTGLSLTSSSLTDTQTDSKQVKRERNALTCTELSSGSVFSQSGQLQHDAFKQAVTRLQQPSWTIMSWTFWAQSISSYQRERKKIIKILCQFFQCVTFSAFFIWRHDFAHFSWHFLDKIRLQSLVATLTQILYCKQHFPSICQWQKSAESGY